MGWTLKGWSKRKQEVRKPRNRWGDCVDEDTAFRNQQIEMIREKTSGRPSREMSCRVSTMTTNLILFGVILCIMAWPVI